MITWTNVPFGVPPRQRAVVNGLEIRLTAMPDGIAYRPDLGVIFPTPIRGESLHAWPPPRNVITAPRSIITPGGDFLVMFIAGTGLFDKDEKVNDMVAYRSSDRGKTWRGPFLAWDVPYSGLAAGLFRPRDSRRLYAFATEYVPELRKGWENGPIGFRTSDDDGRTWSPVELIRPVNDPEYRGIAAMQPCETDRGTWLVSTHAEIWRTPKGIETRQYLLRSEDQGHTWELLPGPGDQGWAAPGFGRMDEGVPIALGDGKVVMQIRTPEGHLWQTWSEDDGKTWSEPRPTTLVHPDAPPMVFTLADGKTLAAFHHNNYPGGDFNADQNHAARAELWVSLSTDEGQTWSEPRFVVATAAQPFQIYYKRFIRGVSYADLLVDGDDLHLFVDFEFRQVLHLRLRSEHLQTLPSREELASMPGVAPEHPHYSG